MSWAAEQIAALGRRVAELERRLENSVRKGKIAKVDPEKGVARIEVGVDSDGKPQLGPWLRTSQTAGALKVHTPATEGQTYMQIAPGGDFEQGLLLPLGWSDDNPAPSKSGTENVITYGAARVEMRSDEIVVTVPRVRIVCGGSELILEDGQMVLKGVTIREN